MINERLAVTVVDSYEITTLFREIEANELCA